MNNGVLWIFGFKSCDRCKLDIFDNKPDLFRICFFGFTFLWLLIDDELVISTSKSQKQSPNNKIQGGKKTKSFNYTWWDWIVFLNRNFRQMISSAFDTYSKNLTYIWQGDNPPYHNHRHHIFVPILHTRFFYP